MKKRLILAALMCASVAMTYADGPSLKLTPTGRVLMDGALYDSSDDDLFKDGMAIPDVRLGLKGSYGNWSGKIDVSFAGGKVGIKDLNIQYNFNPENFLRAGNFIHQYGYQVSTSSSMKPTFEEPLANSLFNTGRQIGVMYEHSSPKYFGTLSFHMEPNTITTSPNDMNGQGIGVLSRQIWRPIITDDGTFFQIGISGGFATAQQGGTDGHEAFSFSGNFPTRVDKVAAQKVTIDNARNMFKFTPELMAAYGRVALEAQYFYNRVNRKDDLHSWSGQGAYADVRMLLLGNHYTYAMADGGIATPAPKSLELVVMYNYSSLSDSKAQYIDKATGDIMTGIYGGRTNTVSATLTYYINKYFLARLNYAHTHRWNAQSMGFDDATNFNVVQMRLQFLF